MEHIPHSNMLDSPAEFSAGSFTPPGTPPPLPGVSFTPPGSPPSLADGSSTPQGTPPRPTAGSFTAPGIPPRVPDVSFTPPGTPPPPPPPSNPVPIPTPEVIEISDDDDEPMEQDPVEQSWRRLSHLIKNREERIRAALQTLAPEDGERMIGFFRKMMKYFLELSENTHRDRLDAREHSYLLRDIPQIQLILQATEESNAQLLADLINHWISLIQNLSNARRSQRIQDLLASMKNPPARSARRHAAMFEHLATLPMSSIESALK
ncbi:uncharacterized protein PGTG_02909 [Puccinia graminis f. sp. tritici CRL 75-36-700-3]|uniref:Uncharacterized protein n=1 Tax=Puccinia graminis f. sp. tritici (strain CRL 75-36-700-3 / race SCCL) TaxID=418459 RepID=E3JWP3_PUCGT|nr:uncharacterized protein PGTG_02909 [Puccinia graminis f. sp. tritici CRL 75-36-700-3]EFP76468.2 hypothetical protein PGTG_02909 [Puccinia graminis f. sp. tritici CRL 75-36-700-3]